ncbi:MAG: ROK family protein [Candidatus Melainabacteria bacterium]
MSTPVRYAIGIDIGGTKIAGALVAIKPETTDQLIRYVEEHPTPEDPKAFMDTLVNMVENIREKSGVKSQIEAVGISTAGTVNTDEGRIIGSTANLPAAQGENGVAPLRKLLEARVHLPVHVENDANAAAYGEMAAGAAMGMNDMVMVTLGTGVGTGIVINGKMIRGAHYSAGEGGHIIISQAPRQCSCGKPGCWEAYASGKGLKVSIREMVQTAPSGEQAVFLERGNPLEKIGTHDLFHAQNKGSKLAATIVERWHQDIVDGMRSIINLLDPEAIVVGGGLAQFVDFDQLTTRLKPLVMTPAYRILPAELGNNAGLVGAAYLAIAEMKPLPAAAGA